MTWGFIWMMVVLKIPIVALLWLVWWAVRSEPEPADGERSEGGGGEGHSPRPRKPRPPRRGDHAEPAPQPPPRIRVVSRSGRERTEGPRSPETGGRSRSQDAGLDGPRR